MESHILHVADESTRYQAARRLPTISAESVWTAMRLCWIDVYLISPDLITNDAGKQFVAKVFQSDASLMKVKTRLVPVKAPNSLSFVERYHTPIRRAINIIKTETVDLSDKTVLQMAVKSVNDSIESDGLTPTLFVFEAFPRLGIFDQQTSLNIYKRAAALRRATEEMTKHFARRQVNEAVRTLNGPNTLNIKTSPIDSHAMVCRPEKDHWKGPYSILDIDGEYSTLLLPPPSRPSKFRTTVVKLYFPETPHVSNIKSEESNSAISDPPSLSATSAKKEHANNTESIKLERFINSRIKEVSGLIEWGVFDVANIADVNGMRIFGSRFCR